ncbi:MAG: Hsp33 family molecular chaperone HslO [Bacillota bacterium]|nr:Hsp33 family molecular chaperone HslO [Bacillota bacterium]
MGPSYLVHAVGADGRLRVMAADASAVVREAARRHGTWPTATAALGRLLTATAFLAADAKHGSVTVRLAGEGPLRGAVAVGEADGRLRGYVGEPHVDLPLNGAGKLDVGGAVGRRGFLYVTYQPESGRAYTGSVPLVTGEVGDDLTEFFRRSAQRPAVVGVGVLVGPDAEVRAAGGLLVELLPSAVDELAETVEANLGAIGSISRLIEAGARPEELAGEALKGCDWRLEGGRLPLAFRCACSREKVEATLVALGPEELRRLEGDGRAEVRCHFCNAVYTFTRDELRRLAALAGGPAGRRGS